MIYRSAYAFNYIFYLSFLALGSYYLMIYCKVPEWTWFIFLAGIFIFMIGLIIKEFFIKRYVKDRKKYYWLLAMYLAFHAIGIALFIAGISLTIKYSNIQWWTWILICLGALQPVIATIMLTFQREDMPIKIKQFLNYCSLSIVILGIILLIIGTSFAMNYSKAPWWLWIILVFGIVCGLFSNIFELLSYPIDSLKLKTKSKLYDDGIDKSIFVGKKSTAKKESLKQQNPRKSVQKTEEFKNTQVPEQPVSNSFSSDKPSDAPPTGSCQSTN